MVRSATTLISVLILSGFVVVQQVATHTVVKGDTLWDLAQSYYQNPFEWRRIWEANKDKVADPNLIYPDQVLTIPGKTASVGDVVVEAPAGAQPAKPPAEEPPVAPPNRTPMKDRPTIFRQDTAVMRSGVYRRVNNEFAAVPRGMVMAAPWLVRLGQEVESLGSITDFAGGVFATETARGYDRVRLHFTGPVPAVGTQLQVFRPEKTIESVGTVMQPTGTVSLVEVDGDSAVAVVGREFSRMSLGDFVRALPAYDLKVGQQPQPVTDGGVAMVMGFAGPNVVQDVGGIAFLDQGSNEGVNIGDEYEYLNPEAGTDVVEGKLQVVGVTPGIASARILSMDDVVFRQGIVVRLARKMR